MASLPESIQPAGGRMISIINCGKPHNPAQEDQRIYEVCINRRVLFSFLHNRNDGLAACLARACKAALEYELKENTENSAEER